MRVRAASFRELGAARAALLGLGLALMGGALSAQEPVAALASLEVTMMDSITGVPISGARVTLQPLFQGDAANATSAADGKAAFLNLKPGRYNLFARKDGYMLLSYGVRSNRETPAPVELEAGKEARKLVYGLMPNGQLSGKVVGPDGAPVAGASLALGAAAPYGDLMALDLTTEKTAEDGAFRISLPDAGQFYILAIPPAPARGAKEAHALAPAFFPSAREFSGAAPLLVQPGRDVSGIRITLRDVPQFAVRGKLSAPPQDWPAAETELLLIPKAMMSEGAFTASARVYRALSAGAGSRGVQPDGSFEFPAVEPGQYDLFAYHQAAGQKPPAHFGRIQVNVTDHAVEDVFLPRSPALRLTWRVRIPNQQLGEIRCNVVLNPADGDAVMQTAFASTGADGLGTAESVVRGLYWPNLTCRPDGMAVESAVLRDGSGVVDILDSGLDLRGVSMNATVDVTLRARSATVTGTVKLDGAPAPRAWVTLIPEPPGRARMLRFRQGWASEDGRFSLTGVAPGEYRLYAWRGALAGDYFLEKAFLQRYESQATKVSVKGEETVRTEATLAQP